MITFNIKNAFLLFGLLFIFSAVKAQNQFVINGQLGKDKNGLIMLYYNKHGVQVTDSATVTGGKFTLKGEIGDPAYATLNLNPNKGAWTPEAIKAIDTQNFFIDGPTTTVQSAGTLRNAVISGGKAQKDLLLRNAPFEPFTARFNVLQEQGKKYPRGSTDTTLVRIQHEMQEIVMKTKKLDSLFIAKHPDSYVAFDSWSKKHKGTVDPSLENELNKFSSSIRNTEEGKKMAAKIGLAKKLDAGQFAPDFTLPDLNDKQVSLSSLKGKNVLLVFWTTDFLGFDTFAFNLGRINRRLKDKNLVILGVYYNNSNEGRETPEYINAVISQNNMNWLNLTDINGIGFSNNTTGSVAKSYGLETGMLPMAYLIGPDGKILARRLKLSDQELSLSIEKLLK